MSNVGIYKITNPEGLVYIGQSHNIPIRMRNLKHQVCDRPRKLYLSISKYGWDKHIKEVAHELPKDVSQAVLDTYEKLYMECYRDCGIELFNIKEGGLYGKHGKETIDKVKGRPRPDFKGKTSQFKGKKHSAESLEKMSKFQKGRTKPPRSSEYRKNISLAHLGKPCPWNYKKVIDTKTGIIYNSILEASKVFNINYSTLTARLNGSKNNKTTLKYYTDGS